MTPTRQSRHQNSVNHLFLDGHRDVIHASDPGPRPLGNPIAMTTPASGAAGKDAEDCTRRRLPSGEIADTTLRDGTRFRYVRVGHGQPLVPTHTVRTQLDLFRRVIPRLSPHFAAPIAPKRTVAPLEEHPDTPHPGKRSVHLFHQAPTFSAPRASSVAQARPGDLAARIDAAA